MIVSALLASYQIRKMAGGARQRRHQREEYDDSDSDESSVSFYNILNLLFLVGSYIVMELLIFNYHHYYS